MPRQLSHAPITAETVEHATAKCGRVDTETDAGPRILRTAEDLRGEAPRDWIARQRRRFGLAAPWDGRSLGLEAAS